MKIIRTEPGRVLIELTDNDVALVGYDRGDEILVKIVTPQSARHSTNEQYDLFECLFNSLHDPDFCQEIRGNYAEPGAVLLSH